MSPLIGFKNDKELNFFKVYKKNIFLKYCFHESSWIFGPLATLTRYHVWLIRAAVGQIDFCLEVFLNLTTQLNTLLNNRLE